MSINVSENVTSLPKSVKCSVQFHSMSESDIAALVDATAFTSVLNSVTAPAAVFANIFVILAIGTTPSLHCPSNILLCCLAVTDILNGLIVQPLLVMLNVSRIQGNYELYCIASTGFSVPFGVLCTVSFLILTLISVDRYLAIHFPFRYNLLVTNKRVFMTAILCWIVCSIDLVFKLKKYYRAHFAFFFLVLLFGMVVSSGAYCGIFRTIHKHETRIAADVRLSLHLHGSKTNVMKRHKMEKSMAYLSLLFLLCYFPYVPNSIINALYSGKPFPLALRIAGNVTVTLILVNSALNPLFYCYRLRNIRRAVLRLFGIRGNSNPEQDLSLENTYHGERKT